MQAIRLFCLTVLFATWHFIGIPETKIIQDYIRLDALIRIISMKNNESTILLVTDY